MSETKKLFKSGFSLFAGKISVNLLTIGFTIFFAHTLSKEEFSLIAVFLILLNLTNMLSNLGLETNCLREIPLLINNKSYSLAAAMLKTTVLNRFICSLIIAFVVFSNSNYFAELFFKDPGYSGAIKIVSFGILLGSLNTSFELLGQSLQLFKEIAIIRFFNALTYCSVAITLYFIIGYKGWVIGYSWSRIVGLSLYLIVFFKWLKIPSGFFSWKKLVKSSLPYYLKGYMRFGEVQLDQLIVGIFLGPSALATYFVAKRLSSSIGMIIESVSRPLLIKLAELKSYGKIKTAEALGKISRYNTFIFVPICLGLIAFCHPLLEIYGGTKYLNAYPVLIILCLDQLVKGVWSGVYINGLFIIGSPTQTLYVDTAGCISNIIFLLILVPLLYEIGVALSVLLSTVIAVFAAYTLLNKQVKVVFDINNFIRVFFVAIVVSGIVVFIQTIKMPLAMNLLYGSGFFLVLIYYIVFLLKPDDVIVLEKTFSGKLIIFLKVLYFFGLRKTENNRFS